MATALPLAYDSHSELELHREYSVDGSVRSFRSSSTQFNASVLSPPPASSYASSSLSSYYYYHAGPRRSHYNAKSRRFARSTTPTPTRTRKRKRLPSLTSSSSCSSDDEDIVGARRTRIRGRAHSTRYEALAWDEGLPICTSVTWHVLFIYVCGSIIR